MGEGRVLFVGNETLQVIEEYKVAAGITRGALFRRVLKGGKATTARLTPEGCERNRRKAESSFSWGEGACIWSFAPGRFGGVVGSWERVAGGDASGWPLEGFTNAKPLCRRGAR